MDIYTYGDPEADIFLIQMVDDHDMEVIEQEVSYIRELTGGKGFCLKAVKVNSWNNDLSPWPAPAVFGNEDFGGDAAQTLKYLLEEVLQDNEKDPAESETDARDKAAADKKLYLGGYSLAGLFALWAGCQSGIFDGIAAASPSVWFPGFTDHMKAHPVQAPAVYLSLGDREEKTRNPVMSQVGNAIREAYDILYEAGRDCILEWNKGNHFKEPDLRTAKAFSWLINKFK